MARRHVGKLMPPDVEKSILADEEGVDPLTHKTCKGRIDLAASGGVEDQDLQSSGASSRFHVSQRGLCIRSTGRIDEYGNASHSRHQLPEEFQALCSQLTTKKIDTCQVAARPGEAGNKTEPDRVAGGGEDDGGRRGCCLSRE